MSLQLGDTAPDFTAETTAGKINLYDYLGDGWGILFSHPADYTPVCTTELGKTALLQKEFEKRNTKVLAVSVDPLDKHHGWTKDINETQNCHVEFPIIADEDKTVATLYGMIHPNASTTGKVPERRKRSKILYEIYSSTKFVKRLLKYNILDTVSN